MTPSKGLLPTDTTEQSFGISCTHLTVKWQTEELLNGLTRGSWFCTDCEMKFTPYPMALHLETQLKQAQAELAALRTPPSEAIELLGWVHDRIYLSLVSQNPTETFDAKRVLDEIQPMLTKDFHRRYPHLTPSSPCERMGEAEAIEDVVGEYLHWRKVNPQIKGGENYLKRLRDAQSASPDTQTVIGLLQPIADQDWHGKWRIQKAIAMLGGQSVPDVLKTIDLGQIPITVHDDATAKLAGEYVENAVIAALRGES